FCRVFLSRAPLALPSFPTRRSSDLITVTSFVLNYQSEKASQLAVSRVSSTVVAATLSDSFRFFIFWAERFLTVAVAGVDKGVLIDRKSTRLNSSHVKISYAVFCLKK